MQEAASYPLTREKTVRVGRVAEHVGRWNTLAGKCRRKWSWIDSKRSTRILRRNTRFWIKYWRGQTYVDTVFVYLNNLLWFGWNDMYPHTTRFWSKYVTVKLCSPDSVVSEPTPTPTKCPYTLRTLTISQLLHLRVNPTLLHHQAEPAVSAAPVCQLGCIFRSTVHPLNSQTVTFIQMSPLSTFKVTQCNQKGKMHNLVSKFANTVTSLAPKLTAKIAWFSPLEHWSTTAVSIFLMATWQP